MKFGPVPVAEAEGTILAHSRRLDGRALKKGRVLSRADIDALAQAGIAEVVAARLEPGDVGEDAAAGRIAEACQGPGLSRSDPFTSRANLHAEAAGVAVVDQGRLDAMNSIDEAVTVATIPPYEVVHPRQLVATVKVIPFAVAEAVVKAWEAAAAEGGPPIRVAPFRRLKVGLVQTRLEGMKETVLDKTAEVTRVRVEALGGALVRQVRCHHDESELRAAIGDLRAAGAQVLLIIGASAIVDRRDVIPAAIEGAGGVIEHYGMPVDPGNLILMGRLGRAPGEAPILGLQGCARSQKLNGFDLILSRLMADVLVTPKDIMRMGVGGLLKEIPSRPLPRAATAAVPAVSCIGAIVLAAGQARRMGAINKLMAEVDGVPMVVRAVVAALASRADPVVVVTGHEPERVRMALRGRRVLFAHNPSFAQGLSTSLGAGVAALPAGSDGVVVCLGDMPRVTAAHIDRLIAAFDPFEGRAICVPTWRGKRGNPALFARRFFAEMSELKGDVGAKHLIGDYEDLVAEVVMVDDGVMVDIDSPQALTALNGSAAKQA